MRKPYITAVTLLTTGIMLVGNAMAQQNPASNPQPAPAAKAPAAPAAKAQTATTAKTHAAPAKSPSVLVLKTPKDKNSYAIGMNLGKGLHRDAVDIDPSILLRGLKDGLAGGKTLLTDDEARAAMMALQSDLRQKQQAKMQQAGATNLKEGQDFLAANKTKEGVVTLPSGLQYKILKEGTGPKPTADDSVVSNYRGTLLDGTEFDSTAKHGGQPATFGVGQVIKGWTEALELMPVGSKWQLFIPSDLAYGARGAGANIGPNATLIFEVELLSIQPKSKPAVPPAPVAPPK
ncbi:MAG: FKBP-type peptidyl-prolyl cis-trans isomerase N-terminal domain-containing protein [Terriglobia bacterium]